MQVFLLISAVAAAYVSAQQCQPTTTPAPPGDDCIYPEGCSSDIQPNDYGYSITTGSPFYDVCSEGGYDHEDIDSSCYTYAPFGYQKFGVFIQLHWVKFSNGEGQIRTYIQAPVAPGVFRSQGLHQNTTTGCDTCVYNDYILGQPSPEVFVLDRCILYGKCDSYYGRQSVKYAISSSPNITDDVYNKIITEYNFTDPIRLPYALSAPCVVSMNNTEVLNYERVPCEYRVKLVYE